MYQKKRSTSDSFNNEIETTPNTSLVGTSKNVNVSLSTQNQFSTPSNFVEMPSDKIEVMEHSLCVEYENSSADDTTLG